MFVGLRNEQIKGMYFIDLETGGEIQIKSEWI